VKINRKKAWKCGKNVVSLGRGGRVMPSCGPKEAKNKFVYMEYFSYLCI
jgi:hypothetical protein